MVTCDWLEEEIQGVLPDCDVEAIDLNGTDDHFHIRIISQSFDGMRPLQRQKIILNHFKDVFVINVTLKQNRKVILKLTLRRNWVGWNQPNQ